MRDAEQVAVPNVRYRTHCAPKAQFCLAKYPPLFVRKYRRKYPHLCTHLRRHMCRSLHLDLNLDLFPNLNLCLNLNLGPSLFRSLLPALFRFIFLALFGAKQPDLDLNLYLNPAASKLRGRHRRGQKGDRGYWLGNRGLRPDSARRRDMSMIHIQGLE